MTSEAKSALSKTIRKLRATLIRELGEATDGAYRLSIDAKKAALRKASRIRRARLEGWIAEQVRALPANTRDGAAERFRDDVVKDAAATLLQRLVYLRLLEAAGLRPDPIVTGGWESRGYKDFREAAPELVRPDRRDRDGVRDETEGYATLLQLVFDELAIDLPGLYGPVRMTSLVPIPAATLRTVVTALDDEALTSVWTDDTTLGWIYQYWNDPEREALDAKLAASKKLENHEIASKTQMFTERYMVEWLLHNSLGQMWLAMCRKHGWTADVERPGLDGQSLLDRLDARRADWRARREANEVALDALMPIEPGLEDRWKYWVPQPMPDDAVTHAPDTIRTLKLLDPACGSGHFLVIATELLFHLYLEEARHRGETWSDREIVESILENNLHGIDIDPRAVEIAAAALMLKARQLCRTAEPRSMNLVAPNLGLANLDHSDPARLAFYGAVERETGISSALTAQIVDALAGADHLGTLLRIERELNNTLLSWHSDKSPLRESSNIIAPGDNAKNSLHSLLERFLEAHKGGPDLGLCLRGEQVAAGVRFVRLACDAQYDIVVGNPPYQGTRKMANTAYLDSAYRCSHEDLYSCFVERSLELARPYGMVGLLTMRGWLFLRQFADFRIYLQTVADLRVLGDLDRGAFEDVPDEILSTVMSVLRRTSCSTVESIALQPTVPSDQSRDSRRTARKRAALISNVGRFSFRREQFGEVEGAPLIYWWSVDFLRKYLATPKLGASNPAKYGLGTRNDVRFIRFVWELDVASVFLSRDQPPTRTDASRWHPYVKGASGRVWIEPVTSVVRWGMDGFELRVWIDLYRETKPGGFITNDCDYFSTGVSVRKIGAPFTARAHRYRSIFGDAAPTVVADDVGPILCLLNSSLARNTLASLNPTVNFQPSDVNRLAIFEVPGSSAIYDRLTKAFDAHEAGREQSIEFQYPAPSPWAYAQDWAQRAVDRPASSPLPEYEVGIGDAPSPHTFLSYAVGVVLGRFKTSRDSGFISRRVLFLTNAVDDLIDDVLSEVWARYGSTIDGKRTAVDYLQNRFFPDVHRKMYENRPIYFPLSSSKKTFVAFASIHRWTSNTLNDVLAEHLYPTKKRLEGEQADLKSVRDGGDKKAAKAAEKRLGKVADWLEELNEFIEKVEQCAERGPPPVDGKTKPREVDAKYEMDLDDGVMVNAAALWPLLEPQWKDPKKWWKELANAEGKRDYDWSHLAKRYFPERVDAKCKVDPSLAVAHRCLWKYHPAKAYQWELRLQDEIRPDFTIEEEGADAARKAFEKEHPDEVEALVEKEQLRRQRKQAKADKADKADDGEESEDAETDDEDADEDDQEMSA